MALVSNGWLLGGSPCRWHGGTALVAGVAADTGLLMRGGSLRNLWDGEATGPDAYTASVPNGYEGEGAWRMAPRGGGLAAYKGVTWGMTTQLTSLSMGVALDADLSASLTLNDSAMALIVQLAADLSAGADTSAALQGIINLAADLSAAGDLDSSLALIAWCTSALTMTWDTPATLRGTASLAADLTTAGEILNSANAGAAIWGYIIENGLSALEAQRLILAAAAGDIEAIDANTRRVRAAGGAQARIVADVTDTTRDVTTLDVG